MTETPAMTSNRPYLLRALHEWISDNGLSPYLLVDAAHPGVRVPPGSAKDGKVVLNIAARAVNKLELGNEAIHFLARFNGVSQVVDVPMTAVLAIYAQENGQGMMFPAEDAQPPEPEPDAPAPEPQDRRARLRVVK
ncbi:ClpXP protease specificity-enhancing factor [Dokdonella koreensis]|uniref:Stringent starvation protein B n=1 Tax=Dokdonella koreensis DS-123 TaxID=1300342 RepID=A0A160DVL1_9GAMM|nr:ClpXP protease specificity-enhancing factor [Dokdonella koreensis]ANB18404.1 Stringent starvation protein B [Dokdonella koreensis DS-123]